MKSKCPDSHLEGSCLFFAEVKVVDGEKHYFCCPLQPDDDGIYITYIYCLSHIFVT